MILSSGSFRAGGPSSASSSPCLTVKLTSVRLNEIAEPFDDVTDFKLNVGSAVVAPGCGCVALASTRDLTNARISKQTVSTDASAKGGKVVLLEQFSMRSGIVSVGRRCAPDTT